MIDIEELKRLATERPNDFDFKPSGVLKLIAEIERLGSMTESHRQGMKLSSMEINRLRAENASLKTAPTAKQDCAPVPVADATDWTEWQFPIMRGYRMQCCDCGLIHEAEFQAVKVTTHLPDGEWGYAELDTKEYRVGLRMRREDD